MKKTLYTVAILVVLQVVAVSCQKAEEENYTPPTIVTGDEDEEEEDNFDYPEAGAEIPYSPSLIGKPYRPIQVKYSSAYPPITSWKTADTRIVHYMSDYTPAITTYTDYKNATNKYGSSVTLPRQSVTGRFYTKKIDGRWWIVDSEGYLHYQRGVASFRQGSSSRNKEAWSKRFSTTADWVSSSQRELAEIGFHGTGAFCTDTYSLIQTHNNSYSERPLTLAPSFGFLSAFQKESKHAYPGGDSSNAVGLVFYSDWESFCKTYVTEVLAPYKNDPNTLGFFSDNEINFSSSGSRILDRFLNLNDDACPAYVQAKQFMADRGATKVTDELNSEFAGIVAEKYYKAVKEAVSAFDKQLLYLGSRLHGTPKYLRGVVEAAGRWCDIISINYYSRWSPELDGAIADWAAWADKPFLVTEFYTKGVEDSDLNNQSGAGYSVPTQNERAYAYQHFTLGLLEAKNCVGWHWFKYQDDDGTDNSSKPANKGMYDNYYVLYPVLSHFAQEVNFNVYDLIDYFDN